ncbi:LysR family transcriptional regulator [Stappia sp. MMSF_3263]|uniref:LysR family transcriptional regulator n=1 Tax=Stappia sp. MMSF_3263 TaxID=3046693 RepID=UPI00273F7681|nr:LysR family transcriptional regulator [Stappia sp. MMSF_3263]
MTTKYPLRSLQVFESVARHLSYGLAATELNISPSAISHQINNLRSQVGEELFTREKGAILLTPKGQRLADSLNIAFEQINESVRDCIGGSEKRTVRIAVCSCFGFGWISRRISKFAEHYPDIDLQLRMYTGDPLKTDAVADIFVSIMPFDSGFYSAHLLDEDLVCVAPWPMNLAALRASPLPLITTSIDEQVFCRDWTGYVRACNLDLPQIGAGHLVQCSHYILALSMVREGVGIGLLPGFLAQDDLQRHCVHVVEGTRTIPSGKTYHIGYKLARRDDRNLRQVVDWIRRETSLSLAEPAQLARGA